MYLVVPSFEDKDDLWIKNEVAFFKYPRIKPEVNFVYEVLFDPDSPVNQLVRFGGFKPFLFYDATLDLWMYEDSRYKEPYPNKKYIIGWRDPSDHFL